VVVAVDVEVLELVPVLVVAVLVVVVVAVVNVMPAHGANPPAVLHVAATGSEYPAQILFASFKHGPEPNRHCSCGQLIGSGVVVIIVVVVKVVVVVFVLVVLVIVVTGAHSVKPSGHMPHPL
jgi:hypothetical protein